MKRMISRIRKTNRAALSAALMEPMEGRQFCDGSFATAVALGPVQGLVVKLDSLNTTTNKKDFYKVTLAQAGRLRISLDALTADANLYLYSGPSAGALIGTSAAGGNTSELIDKPTVAAGTYYVEVRQISGTPHYTLGVQTDFAGNSLATARNVGAVTSSVKNFNDFIGNSDTQDYYKFTTSANGVTTLKLDGLTNDVDLQLLNSAGTPIKSSIHGGSAAELILNGASAGTYYAKVYQFNSTSNYALHISNAPVPPDNAGNNHSLAKDLGVVGGTKTASDWIVNKFDHDDFYKITVKEPGDIVANITGLSADLNVEIDDASGLLVKSSFAGTSSDTITYHSTTGGVYYVRVFQGGSVGIGGATSQYNLSITAPTDTAPDTRLTAKTLTLSGGHALTTGFVGVIDREDWYKVSAGAGKTITSAISGLNADADLYLYDSVGNLVSSSAHSGTTSDQVTATAGSATTYYIRVLSFNTNNTFYTLSVTVA